MKKTLFLAILAGAALAGCVKNEEIAMSNDGSPDRITFDAPVVNIPTRATEIYGNYPSYMDFAVWALYHESKYDETAFDSPVYYMKDVTCVSDDPGTKEAPGNPTTWNPTPLYYWPKNGYLTFAAYAPSSVAATWDAEGFHFTDFTVNEEPTEQIDLLYSGRQYDKQNNTTDVVTNQPYDGVTIPFKHALSSIIFKVQATADYGETFITLTGIKVNNVVKKGTFNQKLQAAKTGDSNKAEWTLDPTVPANVKDSYIVYPMTGSTETSKRLNVSEVFVNGVDDNANDKYGTYTDKDGNVIPNRPNSPEEKNDGIRRSDLILIPQDLVRGANDMVTVTIDYTITNAAGDELEQSSTFQMAVKGTDDALDANVAWEMGKRYIYHISIGLEKIYFNPQVVNWVDVDNTGLIEIQ